VAHGNQARYGGLRWDKADLSPWGAHWGPSRASRCLNYLGQIYLQKKTENKISLFILIGSAQKVPKRWYHYGARLEPCCCLVVRRTLLLPGVDMRAILEFSAKSLLGSVHL